jgi:chemotaxis protein MotA
MKRRLDPMTVAGLIIGFGLLFFSIMLTERQEPATGYDILVANLKAFYDVPSILIVIGGTFATLMMMFPLSQIKKVPKHILILIRPRQYKVEVYINRLVEIAKKARINGLLSLEADLEELSDPFLKKGLQMLVDGVDPEEVKNQLEAALDSLDERHSQDRSIYDKGAALGPAFGMIGTLIGLINMLKTLQDVESLGPNMSVALVTTFYGTVLANMIFMPISNKLRVRHEEEFLCMHIICEGIKAIQSGINPNLLYEKLTNILPEYQRKKIMAKGETATAEPQERRSRGRGGRGEKRGRA